MNIKEARLAIEAILAAIPDEELPRFDRVETTKEGETLVWFGGTGRHLGSAKQGGERDPLVYRRDASMRAVELEMTYRADKRFLENGDEARGIKLARRTVAV